MVGDHGYWLKLLQSSLRNGISVATTKNPLRQAACRPAETREAQIQIGSVT